VLAQRLLGVSLSDPMSGFFMIRRERFEELAPRLTTQGFKILLDIAATARGTLRIAELPLVFAERQHGESKLDTRVALDFIALIIAKLTNDAVSFRFLLFCLVGLTGIAIHMATLAVRVGRDGARLRRGADGRDGGGDHLEFRAQQHVHLPRPAARGLAIRHRPHSLSADLRGRRDLECRHRERDLRA
jgi:hypothetical protein